MKKLAAIIMVICMLLSASACSAQGKISSDGGAAGQSDSAERTVIGRITEINGNTVTLNATELDMGGMGGNGTRPERPEGEGFTPPDKPDGENFTPPDMPDGENFTPPDKPDGENFTPPDMPDGENFTPPDMPDGEGFTPPGDGSMFAEGGETMTVDLSGIKITDGDKTVSVDELKVGDMITVTFDASGKAVSASLFGAGMGWGGKRPDRPDGE